ncbi:MAG: Processive diacylglycerol beta-glucosyltransferase [Candidatus Dichloromethanomonas elyunquensis]|nr:MAG: Processive diacylglycerol beta-glucosyltransferase [Candidatus Dichloromethanomonas elyunquensis]
MASVLILSASTGQGHNQAANCLKNELETSGHTVTIVEPLKEEGRVMDLLIDDGYNILATKLPKMYGKLYKISGYKFVNKGVVTFLNFTLSRTVYQLIREHQPKLLFTTHPLLVNVVSFLKASRRINLPLIAIVTDYMAHRFYVNQYVDAYIVGSNYTKDTLTEKGVSEKKIFPYGIPISKEFRQPRNTNRDKTFTLLLMGGSMGISYIKNCLKALVHNPHDFKINVVCGNNHKLKKELEEKYSGSVNGKQIQIFGFTKNIPELMDQSDVIVTKPGGLTVTEAINKNIPIIIPFFIPGQEEENTEILVKAGVAVSVSNIIQLNQAVSRLYENPALLEEMRLKAQEISNGLSPDSIVQLSDRLIYGFDLDRISQNA